MPSRVKKDVEEMAALAQEWKTQNQKLKSRWAEEPLSQKERTFLAKQKRKNDKKLDAIINYVIETI